MIFRSTVIITNTKFPTSPAVPTATITIVNLTASVKDNGHISSSLSTAVNKESTSMVNA